MGPCAPQLHNSLAAWEIQIWNVQPSVVGRWFITAWPKLCEKYVQHFFCCHWVKISLVCPITPSLMKCVSVRCGAAPDSHLVARRPTQGTSRWVVPVFTKLAEVCVQVICSRSCTSAHKLNCFHGTPKGRFEIEHPGQCIELYGQGHVKVWHSAEKQLHARTPWRDASTEHKFVSGMKTGMTTWAGRKVFGYHMRSKYFCDKRWIGSWEEHNQNLVEVQTHKDKIVAVFHGESGGAFLTVSTLWAVLKCGKETPTWKRNNIHAYWRRGPHFIWMPASESLLWQVTLWPRLLKAKTTIRWNSVLTPISKAQILL